MKDSKTFLNVNLCQDNQIVCLIGPSGTGKSFCSDFLKHHGYEVATQITTRTPRPDDCHYEYVSHKDFLNGLKNSNILGYYSGNPATLTDGNGYGYNVKYLQSLISAKKKIILFPSAYELSQPDFQEIYKNAIKICITFKNNSSVKKRAIQAKKTFTACELATRINSVNELTKHMLDYSKKSSDINFFMIYSDSYSSNVFESKFAQLKEICSIISISNADKIIAKYLNENEK